MNINICLSLTNLNEWMLKLQRICCRVIVSSVILLVFGTVLRAIENQYYLYPLSYILSLFWMIGFDCLSFVCQLKDSVCLRVGDINKRIAAIFLVNSNFTNRYKQRLIVRVYLVWIKIIERYDLIIWSQILIIHTGGTIGMFKDQNGKFQPKKDRFKQFLETYPYFSDEKQTYFIASQGFTITPQTIFKKKIWYKFIELEHLIDSTNMNITRINSILKAIEQHYEKYDAFIVLHGTDTMSFTASSLSFMIENLKKTIIITGSQGEARNDAINNLLCAITVAGHYQIPQVLLLFDNTLMRGNRTTKTSASSFNSFNSPNYYPIGTLGLKINIKWELVRMCKPDQPTKFTELRQQIGHLKLTPFGTPTQEKHKYLVIQSYGVGNVPTEGPFYQWLLQNFKKSSQQKKIIVNISQVYQSVILNLYATGDMAFKLGLISGSDMTCEAAVAKLSYLATQNLSQSKIRELMVKNLRGQLTEMQDRQALQKQNYVLSCSTMLQKNFSNQSETYRSALLYCVYPKLVSERSSQVGLNQLDQNLLNVSYRFPDGGTLLHQYFKEKNKHNNEDHYVRYLLERKIDVNAVDNNKISALFYALENGHLHEAKILQEQPYKAKIMIPSSRFFRALRNSEFELLQLMYESGDTFLYLNQQKRNAFTYCAVTNNKQGFYFLKDNVDIDDNFYLKKEDIYGKKPETYIIEKGWSLQEDISVQNDSQI